MTPKKYHQYIKTLQEQEFPGAFDQFYEFLLEDINRYTNFAPSHHFRPEIPLMTEKIVADLREKQKRLLSVGCGLSYLERLLASRLGVKPEQISLADITRDHVPPGFEFYQFDMHEEWPRLNGTFDYVIFPESTLINQFPSFNENVHPSSGRLRQPEREDGLYNLLRRALNVLNPQGQVRLTDATADFVKSRVKSRIDSEFPNVTMGYSGDLAYVIKR